MASLRSVVIAAFTMITISSAFAAPSPLGPTLELHVNRVALEAAGPKAAVISSNVPLQRGSFTVLRDGAPELTAPLVALPHFDEWGVSRYYYQADFSALTKPGRYIVRARDDAAPLSLREASGNIEVGPDALFTLTAPALVRYFHNSRWLDAADHHVRVFGSDRFVDAWGGWKDAGGDNGKYLSHLSYANFFNPQQAGFTAWALARAYDASPARFRAAGLDHEIVDEALYGADFMHRLLAPEGYFYMTVFDQWNRAGTERQLTGYVGERGEMTTNYQAALREGGGFAIAALARAARLSRETHRAGEFPAATYLADAERAWAHLAVNNARYADDGKENIIDDYCALVAAIELQKSTGKAEYLTAADARAKSLAARLTTAGWWRSDDRERPFYHGADAGMPVIALAEYLGIARNPALRALARTTIARALAAQATLDTEVANPFDYPRQQFRAVVPGETRPITAGFFMPHANESGYWWQGESARLSSLALAAVMGGRAIGETGPVYGVSAKLAASAQHRLDWTLGRNPYDTSMLYGFGQRNPDYAWASGYQLVGGISNGITGGVGSEEGRGIDFAPGPDGELWRWNEQWIPHTTWMLLAVTLMSPDADAKANSARR